MNENETTTTVTPAAAAKAVLTYQFEAANARSGAAFDSAARKLSLALAMVRACQDAGDC